MADTAEAIASVEEKNRLIEEIMSLLTSSDRDGLEYPDDYDLVLASRDEPELKRIAERLSSGTADDRRRAVKDLAEMGMQSRRDTIKRIVDSVRRLAKIPDLRETAERIMNLKPDMVLAECPTRDIHDLLGDLNSGDSESALARLLEVLAGEYRYGPGGEVYAEISGEAERSLINQLLSLDCLAKVRSELQEYAGASDERERTRLAGDVIGKLWKEHGCGEAGRKLVETSATFEHILNVFIPRGHFVHQFETFLLGCLTFKTVLNLLNADQRPVGLSMDDEAVYRMWLMASSLHDVGYPIQLGSNISKSICDLYDELAMKDCADILRSVSMRSCAEWLENLPLGRSGAVRLTLNVPEHIANTIINRLHVDDRATRAKIQEKWDSQNHGVIGAAIVWQKLIESHCVEVNADADARESTSRDHILDAYPDEALCTAAMCLHSFCAQDFGFAVEYGRMPLTFTLIAMDELQEWNRSSGARARDTAAFELAQLTMNDSQKDRHVLELTFQCQHYHEKERERLLREIAFKRHKLSNLVPYIIPSGNTEFEIHAHFLDDSGECEEILIPILHTGDVPQQAGRH